MHPPRFVVRRDGALNRLSADHGRFTGKHASTIQRRACEEFSPIATADARRERRRIIQQTVAMGPAWESFGVQPLHAVRTPSAKNNLQNGTRHGARTIRQLEQNLTHRDALTPDHATLFRALSARANYLSQDRPDVAFPQRNSVDTLQYPLSTATSA